MDTVVFKKNKFPKFRILFIVFYLLIIEFHYYPLILHAHEINIKPQKPKSTIAFYNVNLVPMTMNGIEKNQTVLIKGNKIFKIGLSKKVVIPKNAKVIDGNGAYLMPGLSDMHIHTNFNWNEISDEWRTSPLNLYLANGVTTIRCFGPEGGDQKYALRWRDKINKNEITGPQIYACGPILFGPVKNPKTIVQDQILSGFDFIKLYSYLSKEDFHKAVMTAKKSWVYTAGHIPFQVGLDGVLSEGMDEIAHIEELAWELFFFDKTKNLQGRKWMSYVKNMAYKQYKNIYSSFNNKEFEDYFEKRILSIAKKIKEAKIPVCTTLFLDKVIITKLYHPEKFLSKAEIKYLPQKYIAKFKQGKEKHLIMFKGGEDFALFKQKIDLMLLRYLKKLDVLLILGTDSGSGWMGMVPGYSIHNELQVLTENGFAPYEAIKIGTVNASLVAEKMNGSGNFGTIEAGKRADLILVKENPLKDINNIKKIIGVMASGKWFDKNLLKRLLK